MTVIDDAEIRCTKAGSFWISFKVLVDADRASETTTVKISMFGPAVPGLAPLIIRGAHVFLRGRLIQRHWKNEAGELRMGLNLVAREARAMDWKAKIKCEGCGAAA